MNRQTNTHTDILTYRKPEGRCFENYCLCFPHTLRELVPLVCGIFSIDQETSNNLSNLETLKQWIKVFIVSTWIIMFLPVLAAYGKEYPSAQKNLGMANLSQIYWNLLYSNQIKFSNNINQSKYQCKNYCHILHHLLKQQGPKRHQPWPSRQLWS